MNPWFETIVVVLIALFGVFLGWVFSRLRKSYWLIGYILSLMLIAMPVATRCNHSLAFSPLLLWLTAGRIRFVILSLAATIGVVTLLSRLPRKSEKVMTCVLLCVVVVWFSVLPFLFPAFIKGHLANLETRVDCNGICYQSTNYTCGPAAAVTALRKLGFCADEGQIAILSHTNPVAGTLPWCLYSALQQRYGADGLKCQYRYFDSIAQLKGTGIMLAVVRDSFFSDHCVAVLSVSDRTVTVADPSAGIKLLSHEEFEKLWRFSGIVLERDFAENI